MYLASLGPQNSSLSTYFIATLDGVGGGGCLLQMSFKKFFTNKRTKSNNHNKGKDKY